MQEFPSVTVIPRPAFAQCSIRACHQAAAGLLIALVCACEQASLPAPGPVPQDLQAASIEQVQRLHIAVGDCATVLSQNLHAHGFSIAAQSPADASLRLQLRHKRPLREHLPIIQTLGWQAHYRADIIGADQRLLLSLYGQEGSLSFRELCNDIGDEIANKLKDYLPDRDLTSRKGAKTQK